MNMQNPQTCLSTELLRRLSRDDLSVEELTDVEDHVTDCERCQQLLEVTQSDSQWRDDMIPVLRTPLESPPLAKDPEERDGDSESLGSLLRLLGPTDDPHMLGRIGAYDIVGVVGRGGMGVVFKAYEGALNRFVAIKMMLPHLAASGAAHKRFAREGQAAAAVIDDHVMPIYGVAEWRGVPYLVTQYSRGPTLQKRIHDHGPLELKEILRIGMQTARGLAAAHAQGLVHRDVKPSNIMLDGTIERALLTDFGLARAVDDASITRTGIIAGTPQFMSPEQAVGDPVDARSDLFSLGSVLYTMCTGRPPFRAETSLGILRRIADDEPRGIREINSSIPTWLCAIIGKLMAKKPSDRYRSAADAANLLEQCLAHVQQPEFIRLPREAAQLQVDSTRSPFLRFVHEKARWPMTKVIVSMVVLLALLAAYCCQSPSAGESLAALQGEWQLVASERDGKAAPADQLFNERLIINGTRFSRPQTAPNGTEIPGESGRLSIAPGGADDAIDLRMWGGTVHGVYKLAGDVLVLCVTRQGGARPDSCQTKPGDSRVLQTYQRKKNSAEGSPVTGTGRAGKASEAGPDRTWEESWMKRIPQELAGAINRDEAQQWLRDNGFGNIESADVTLAVMKRIHPGGDEPSIQRDGVRTYVYGLLRSQRANDKRGGIEVYCLFGEADKLLALHVNPCLAQIPETPVDEAVGGGSSDQAAQPQLLSPMSRPIMAENATTIACIGPEHPVRLGDIVSHADIAKGLEPNIVRLHVWDWSKSDLSRVLLIQRSELGALSPDGAMMLTQEGETIDLSSKQTRQYSGFKVSEGQRIKALHVSPSRNYAAAVIHVRTEVERLATDPPTVDSRHFWSLRLLKLDASTNTGRRLGEYPANARAGLAFTADEASVIYSTDQHGIVRRELPTGKILNTFEPTCGAQGAVGLAVSPDGRLVAAAGYQGEIFLWETRNGVLLAQHELIRADGERDLFFKASVMRFSPDGSMLALVSGNHLKIMNTETGMIIREHHDATRPRYVQVHWSGDAKKITLVTSAHAAEYDVSPTSDSRSRPVTGRNADRLPRVYEWNWADGAPEVKQYSATSKPPAARIDPDMEARRLTGTWRIVDRITAGIEQKGEIGQTVKILHGRMGEVLLKVDPNQSPRTMDVVFLAGPEKGKVLRGIYEWIPDWKANASEKDMATGEALRICTFTEPHPDQPAARPTGFQAGKDVDTAIWACLSHELVGQASSP